MPYCDEFDKINKLFPYREFKDKHYPTRRSCISEWVFSSIRLGLIGLDTLKTIVACCDNNSPDDFTKINNYLYNNEDSESKKLVIFGKSLEDNY